MWLWFLCAAAAAVYSAEGAGAGAARLVCYVEGARTTDFHECTHLIYTGNGRGDKLDALLKEYRKNNPRLKIILRVTESDEDLAGLLKSKNVQGLEIYDAHRSFNKTKVTETVETAKAALSASGGGPLYLALPAHPELLAKYYDLRTLVKKTDLLMVHTHALGVVKKMTYHPSRLSGFWDMMNTDSVVDLVVGLGVPASKVVISLPATARQFTLQNETLSTPGSPTEEDEPKEINQSELCRQLRKGKWTLERDQDLSAPYAFKDKTWISFEDSSSVDVKGKYARVRGLAGLALYDADRDEDTPCGTSLRTALAKVLNQQSRAPRAAVLRSLENEILSAPSNIRALDALQVSPYRITQVVDSDGVIHSIREDTRTEFSCSRQGYFVHPRSCARFYRCVKFDQLSPDYTVFEFDCPAGLAFDSRYEVCVWPGSLPDTQACPGSSEIAPVPRTRFICPEVEGYYVDPENCRWFFACLDHGKSPLTAYEFRCPFGLGFDPARLTCDWPWLVPACAGIGRYEAEAFGFSGATLGGAAAFQGKTADSVNIAAHQSLASGASLNNLVGIQNSLLTKDDKLDANFIASQEAANAASQEFETDGRFTDSAIGNQGESSGISYNVVPAETINHGLVGATDYSNGELYASGSLILDDYRFSDKDNAELTSSSDSVQINAAIGNSGKYVVGNTGKYRADAAGKYVASDAGKYRASQAGQYQASGKYVASDAGKYRAQAGQYVANDAGKYRASDTGQYRASSTGKYVASDAGKYRPSDAGQYRASTGKYVASDVGKYRPDDAGQYRASSTGKYVASDLGKYRPSDAGQYKATDNGKYKGLDAYAGVSPKYDTRYQSGAYYKKDDRGRYIHNPIGDRAKPYEHVSVPALPYDHTDRPYVSTTEGYDGRFDSDSHGGYEYPKPAIPFEDGPVRVNTENDYDTVNIGYVGKTTLIDIDQDTYQKHSNVVIEPDVSIAHVGSSYQNQGGYTYSTTPLTTITSTESPITVTTYKSIYVPEPPRTSIKQVFTYNQPAVTYVQPSVVAVKQYTPAVQVSSYNQGSRVLNTGNYNAGKSIESKEYDYTVPNIKLDIGITYTTPSPLVTVTKQIPYSFSHSEQTVHDVSDGGYQYSTPVTEEPFKKVIKYTTGPSVTEYVEPTVYQQNGYNTQTIVSSTVRPFSVTPTTIYENPFLKYTKSNKQQTQQRGDITVENYGTTSDIGYEQPQTVIYSTPRPVISIQTTVQPTTFSEQNIHTVDAARVNTYHDSSISGYEYSRPIKKFETGISKPASYNQKVEQKSYFPTTVTSTSAPRVDITYEQSTVTINENPILKYTQKFSDASLVSRQEFRQSFSPNFNGNVNSQYENGKSAGFVSTTPSVLVYEDHYTDYESPKKVTYESVEVQPQFEYQQVTNFQKSSASASGENAPNFNGNINSQYENGKSAGFVSTTPSVLVYEDRYTGYESPKKVTYESVEVQPQFEYQQVTNFQKSSASASGENAPNFNGNINSQYENGKSAGFVSTTPSVLVYEDRYTGYESPKKVTYESVEVQPQFEYQQVTNFQKSSASYPTTKVINFNRVENQSPEIQVGYKAEEYLPPLTATTPIQVSTKAPEYLPPVENTITPSTTGRPRVKTIEYFPPTQQTVVITSSTNALEYLPPKESTTIYTSTQAPEYLPPLENTYLPPSTPKPKLNTLEYLPPVKQTVTKFDYTGDLPKSDGEYKINNEFTVSTSAPTYSTKRKNIVVETAKSNVLGFETVGTNAGLVSTTYSTPRPTLSSTTNYLPPETVTSIYSRVTKPIYVRPSITSTTPVSTISYERNSERVFKGSEYIAPLQEINQQNIETYQYTTASPKIRYNPYRQNVSTVARKQNVVIQSAKAQLAESDDNLDLIEVTSSKPFRRTRPKVAVVTKLNDFNPLLVRKLGAVCSCQSPVLILKGRKPNVQIEDNESEDIVQKSTRVTPSYTVTTISPLVSTSFNPIIVPDDSFYEDYQDSNINVEVASAYNTVTERIKSSTPVVSSTRRIVKIRPRVNAVTIAPTYETVLLEKVSAAPYEEDSETVEVDTKSFNRYGPGGWRGRDETLQGSVDCKRAGLFRHPKHCNKFYSCKWDCTKERFTLHVFNCPIQLSFDSNIGACNWPSQGPACQGDTLLNTL